MRALAISVVREGWEGHPKGDTSVSTGEEVWKANGICGECQIVPVWLQFQVRPSKEVSSPLLASLSLIFPILELGSSWVSKQSPWQIPSSFVLSASDPNCLWNNLWIPGDRPWGPASVTTLPLVTLQHSSLVQPTTPHVSRRFTARLCSPALGCLLTHPLLCTSSSITAFKSQPNAQPLWESTRGTCCYVCQSCDICGTSRLHKALRGHTEPWVARVRVSRTLGLACRTG